MNRTAARSTDLEIPISEATRDKADKTGGTSHHCPLVAIGASAGGIEALIRLFDAMPSDSGMAFVVVMHLDPTRESGLVDILGQHTKMKVAEVVDGVSVEPDRIYVIPPATSLTVEEGQLRLSEPVERRGARYPIDRLFDSMATHRRGRAICIVLSGSGSDGTEGLREVKAEGGCVLVQSPSTAKFDAMPQSVISANLADHVLAPEHMPDVLLRYVKHAYSAGSDLFADSASRDASINPVLLLLRSRADHDFRLYKRSTLTRRIHRRMGLCNLHSMEDYVAFLRSQPGELEALARDLMINVTTFFRHRGLVNARYQRACTACGRA